MKLLRKTACFLLALSVAWGCKDDDASPSSFEVSVIQQALQLKNGLGSDVFYFIVERETAALINWAPSVSQGTPFVAAGRSVEIKLGDVTGYTPGDTEAIVYHWVAIEEDGALIPGDIKSIVVSLE